MTIPPARQCAFPDCTRRAIEPTNDASLCTEHRPDRDGDTVDEVDADEASDDGDSSGENAAEPEFCSATSGVETSDPPALGGVWGAVENAIEYGNRVLIEALPTTGKSYGTELSVAETDEPVTIFTRRGHKEQYGQLIEWCEEAGLS